MDDKIYNREDVIEMQTMFFSEKARREAEKRHGFDAEAEFSANVEKYEKEPCKPCDKAQSLKLLRQFNVTKFRDFWLSPTDKFFPAIAEGTLKLYEKKYTHDEAVRYARNLVKSIDKAAAAKAFLYGLANNKPEYLGALPCLYYVENLPDHSEKPYYVGILNSTPNRVILDYDRCGICEYDKPEKRDKEAFHSVNGKVQLIYDLGVPCFHITLTNAIFYLNEYVRLPVPDCSSDDCITFLQLIDFIESQPDNCTAAKLRDAIKKAGILNMKKDRISAVLDALGYLNILHSPTSSGAAAVYTNVRDMEEPDTAEGLSAYPVNLWKGKYGVDRQYVNEIFGGLY